MRVRDLINQLEGENPDQEVVVANDQGEQFELSPDLQFIRNERLVVLEIVGEYDPA